MSWQFWIDRGGTFTDIVAQRPDGTIVSHKLLSENRSQYEDATLQGIRRVMQIADEVPLPVEEIASIKMGTTVATNALLERRGEPTLLCVTSGFGDSLRIGYQARPRLFDRHIVIPEPIYAEVLEIDERVDTQGTVLTALEPDRARRELEEKYRAGLRSIAIVFMHGYRFPDHEALVADIARKVGFRQVSCSHAVSALIKFVGRGDTTTVDAYLSPIVGCYVEALSAQVAGARLMFMQSNGGLANARVFHGKDSILSGPAGGVVGAIRTSQRAGFDKIITFDMGGTSTDVSHFAGELERAHETEVAGVRLRAPMLRIETVAAGGGSIVRFEGGRYRVGPASAGADPGPACYRRGGPLTMTDCNVMLGRIPPDYFPALVGMGGNEPIDSAVVEEGFSALADEIESKTGDARRPEEVADGFLSVGVENMANAIKKISVQRGYDVTEYVLSCFGGAGGQHACRVADTLGIETVLLNPWAGVLSAYGMGLAETRVLKQKSIEAPLTDAHSVMQATLDDLEKAARAEMAAQDVSSDEVSIRCRARIRYAGTDAALAVEYGDADTMEESFEAIHRNRFGFIAPDRQKVVEAVTVEAVGRAADIQEGAPRATNNGAPEPSDNRPMYVAGEWTDSPTYERKRLAPGNAIEGPAIIIEAHSTNVVEPGWRAQVTERDDIVMTRAVPRPQRARVVTDVDPVRLEIFNNLFMSIAEQMGATLENTAYSVNIKERLDFSCAVFDPDGNLIANAPHMPVHLGSMGESVKTILRLRGAKMHPGDVYALNAPYNGGTHLPDVTVVSPVFGSAGDEIHFFVGSRGHHADIGGVTPGSMPPLSTTIDEEGVIFDNMKIVEDGRFLEPDVRAALARGPYPARSPDVNIADLQAQIAANKKGASELRRMIDHFSLPVVHAYMRHVQDNAEEQVRRVLEELSGGSFRCELDDGAIIDVVIRVDTEARSAVVDFSGTSPQQPTNFNAPLAVCRAAVLYVFRTLVDEDIPLNEGCLKPIEIVVPEGSMLNPTPPAAVVAGNVETSQVICDALYGALGILAAAQGTMNNFTFGNQRFQYYETVCGGSGAGPDHDGTAAVHTHMTNSRLTDPEVLESRFPVRLESFAIRRGSGGRGSHFGGDGVVRRIRFLEEMEAAILSHRRRVAPFGLAGGESGAVGRNTIERADGRIETLAGTDQTLVEPGDVFVIETPGGGAFGPSPEG